MGIIGTVLAVAAIGAGVAEGISAISGQPKPPAPPALPDPTKAKTDAQANVNDQRRTLLASGGQTDYTQGQGSLSSSDVSKTTLLGG